MARPRYHEPAARAKQAFGFALLYPLGLAET